MIYLLTNEEYEAISGVINPTVCTFKSYGVAITRLYFERFIESNEKVMTTICSNKFGQSLEDWVESRKHYKFKLYKFVESFDDPYAPPFNIDFTTGLVKYGTDSPCSLQKKKLPKIDGVPTFSEYYETYDGTEYSNIVLKVAFLFEYDSIGFNTKQDKKIIWYYENGDECTRFTKLLPKSLSSDENFADMLKEGVIRRQNIVDDIQKPIINMLYYVYNRTEQTKTDKQLIFMGRDLLSVLATELEGFVSRALEITDPDSDDYEKKVAYVGIRDYTGDHDEWLDVNVPAYGKTARSFIMDALDT